MTKDEIEFVARILANADEAKKKREAYSAELLQQIDDAKTMRSWSSCSGKPLSEPMSRNGR